jgi:hypothetical protein
MLTDPAEAAFRKRARLAIAIPAYGRASAIANSIAEMAEQALPKEVDIAFYVSDDTPDSSVRDALQPLMDAGLPMIYRSNSPSLGHDRNLIATLLWPNADYVWLLGSAHTVKPGQLVKVYRFLEDQDLVFVNRRFPDYELVPVLRGQAALDCLRNRLWHQTLTGVTVYGQRVRDWVALNGGQLKIMPDFPQLSVILGYASHEKFTIGVFGEPSLQSSGSDTPSYWRNRAVDVFVDNWSALVSAFPAVVPPEHRVRVVREHSARTQLFNTTNLIHLREIGQYRWGSLKKRHFRDAMHLPMWKLLILLTLPVSLLKIGGHMLAKAKKLVSKLASKSTSN